MKGKGKVHSTAGHHFHRKCFDNASHMRLTTTTMATVVVVVLHAVGYLRTGFGRNPFFGSQQLHDGVGIDGRDDSGGGDSSG